MGWLLARCRIACQIAMLGIIGMLGMLMFAGVSWVSQGRVDASDAQVAVARTAQMTDGGLQIALLQARRSEKDFVVRVDEASIAAHAQAMTAARAALSRLEATPGLPVERVARLTTVRQRIDAYDDAFATFVKDSKTLGLNEEQGLQGELRKTVHDVEDRLTSVHVPAAVISMLMMRRHEKDFIARRDMKYAAQLKGQLPVFLAAVEDLSIDPALREALVREIKAYQDSFARFVAATFAKEETLRSMSKLYAEVEPVLKETDDYFAQVAADGVAAGDEVVATARKLMIWSFVGTLLVVVLFSWITGRGIARPILAVTRAMGGLMGGDLNTPIPTDDRRDEIGTMVAALNSFKQSLIAAEALKAEQAAAAAAADAAKRAALVQMAEQIERQARDAVTRVGTRTAAMTVTAGEMRDLATRTGASAQAAAEAADLARGNAETVASAAEELEASIREISGQVGRSAAVVNEAVAAGDRTRGTIDALNERVGRIGAVADIIGDIASKTNLLALNATIEAARAGEAGKGFAVVASEVKQLANQTARSTEEISRHIADVRAATQEAVQAMALIGTTISEVNTIAGSIAAAVEQQGAATAEIARSVTQTAAAVNEVSVRNGEVSAEAAKAGEFAADVLTGTHVLDEAMTELRGVLVRTVRTSTEEVDRRTAERYRIPLACRISTGDRTCDGAALIDISSGGAKLSGAHGLTVGARGSMTINGISGTLPFVVRNLDRGDAGVAFEIDAAMQATVRAFVARQGQLMAA